MEKYEHKKSNKPSTQKVNDTIRHFVPDFDKYSKKEQNMIKCAASLYLKKYEVYLQTLRDGNCIKIDVSGFCKEYGISRMALYKKDEKGNSKYHNIISVLNKMSLELESVKIKKMRETLIEKDEDSKLLDNLLKQQIEYFELKDENAELRKKIKRLE